MHGASDSTWKRASLGCSVAGLGSLSYSKVANCVIFHVRALLETWTGHINHPNGEISDLK